VSTVSVLLVALLLAGCATTYHPADGNVHRTRAECVYQHQYDEPEQCQQTQQTVVDGTAVATIAWMVLYTALIVLVAVGGHR